MAFGLLMGWRYEVSTCLLYGSGSTIMSPAKSVGFDGKQSGQRDRVFIRSLHAPLESVAGALHPVAMRSLQIRACLMLATLLVTALVASNSRSAFEARDKDWEGMSELLELSRQRFGRDRVKLASTLDYDALAPEDAILVVHPENSLDYRQVTAFLQSGGRLALLDDYGSGAAFVEQFGIRRVRAPLKPALTLRQNVDLPIAVPATSPDSPNRRHPIVSQVDHVVTNHPQALEHPGLTPVLVIPAVGEPESTIALTGVIAQRGRLFVLSDPSVFINLMIRYPGNRAFAEGLLDYLVEDRDQAKPGTLYILINRFAQRGSFGDTDSLLSSLKDWWTTLQQHVADLRAQGLPEPAIFLLTCVVAVLLAFRLWSTVGKPYRQTIPRYAVPTPLEIQGGVAGRTALLAAPSTHRALPALELQSALVEAMSDHLGLPVGTSAHALLQEVARSKALEPESIGDLQVFFEDMRAVETLLASGRAVRVGHSRMERWRQVVLRLLAEAARKQGAG